jgi:hypothetical protein
VDTSEHSRLFEDAVAAFEVRFERELAFRWDHLEKVAIEAGSNAGPSDRLDILNQLFEDAAQHSGKAAKHAFLGYIVAQNGAKIVEVACLVGDGDQRRLGGKMRAAKLTPEERRASALKAPKAAAKARSRKGSTPKRAKDC